MFSSPTTHCLNWYQARREGGGTGGGWGFRRLTCSFVLGKLIFLFFLTIKGLFAETNYNRFVFYLKAIYGPKNERNRVFKFCHEIAQDDARLMLSSEFFLGIGSVWVNLSSIFHDFQVMTDVSQRFI